MGFHQLLTYSLAAEILRQLAAERPDFNYLYTPEYIIHAGCMNYNLEDEPSCIVGHVIDRVYGRETLLKMNRAASVEFSLDDAGIAATSKARTLLSRVQMLQDSGTLWGVAVALAREEVKPDEDE